MRIVTRFIFIPLSVMFLFKATLCCGQIRVTQGITFPKTFSIFKKDTVDHPGSKEWKLVFEDNFDGEKPDGSKWIFGPPWGSVFSFSNKDRNDSSQNGGAECARQENLVVHDGRLKLMIKKEEYISNTSYDKTDSAIQPDGFPCRRIFHYTSGVLYSKQKFTSGKFEIRCKLPQIDGLWPAFWLFGDCSQEFDVFEFLNEDFPDRTEVCNRQLHMTYHRQAVCNDPKTWCSHGSTITDTLDYTKDFHTFSVEWDAYQITWKVDGKIRKVVYGIKRYRRNKFVDENKIRKGKRYRLFKVMPEEHPMSIIVSCGVTNYGNAQKPLIRGTFPAVFEIDYIRAYSRN